jgi:hypothetical protein
MDSATDAAIAASIGEFAAACALPERTGRMQAHLEARAAQKKKAPKT